MADVWDESTLCDIHIKGVDPSICHSLLVYWVSNAQASCTNIAVTEQSLLEIPKGSTKLPQAENQNALAKYFGKRSWYDKTANVADGVSTTSPIDHLDIGQNVRQCWLLAPQRLHSNYPTLYRHH